VLRYRPQIPDPLQLVLPAVLAVRSGPEDIDVPQLGPLPRELVLDAQIPCGAVAPSAFCEMVQAGAAGMQRVSGRVTACVPLFFVNMGTGRVEPLGTFYTIQPMSVLRALLSQSWKQSPRFSRMQCAPAVCCSARFLG
jgi:hypothetical protein